jgi:uncharacterized protein YjbJ (UPF0337 family)
MGGPDYSQDWHTYAVDWEPGLIRWYVDGVQRHAFSTAITSTPMVLLLVLAVGGDWPDAPDGLTVFPAYMQIDFGNQYRGHVIKGQWKQIRGKAKEWRGRLTDDDLDVIGDKHQQLISKLQERYSWQAAREIDIRRNVTHSASNPFNLC